MENFERIEKLYHVLNETISILEAEHELTYLEALSLTAENIFQQSIVIPVNDLAKKKLMNKYDQLKINDYNKEEIRKAMQLAILKGMKSGTQPNHMITPDGVALFISYFVNKLTEKYEAFSILDPAVGTGNLLTAILNYSVKPIRSYGVEVDETLLKLAYINANLQSHGVEFFRQDALENLLMDPVDLVISDLPIGYYPDDVRANDYQLKAETGHSFSHHLFIEQGINYTKAGGFLLFIIPNFLFESDQASKLNDFIKENANIIGLLQLPNSMFKNEKFAKSIFILQKKGVNVSAPKQALLAELPKFSNKAALESIMQKIDQWFKQEFK